MPAISANGGMATTVTLLVARHTFPLTLISDHWCGPPVWQGLVPATAVVPPSLAGSGTSHCSGPPSSAVSVCGQQLSQPLKCGDSTDDKQRKNTISIVSRNLLSWNLSRICNYLTSHIILSVVMEPLNCL